MNELGTALRELARDATPTVSDPAAVWVRGRARVRRRRLLAAAAVACVLGVVGIGVVVIPQPPVVMPAGQPHLPSLPSSIYVPTSKLAGTAEEGPLGRLAVLAGAPAPGPNPSTSVFGISATTGAYRHIDLPGQRRGTGQLLSPDGRRIAYWTGGPTTGAPYPSASKVVGGVAIYDTETGAVHHASITSAHGFDPENMFTWVDDNTIVFYNARFVSSDHIDLLGDYRWTVGGNPQALTDHAVNLGSLQRNPDGSFLNDMSSDAAGAQSTLERLVWTGSEFTPIGGPTLKMPRPTVPPPNPAEVIYSQLSWSGDLVAAFPVSFGDPGSQWPPLVGRVASDGRATNLHLIGSLRHALFLGWRNADTVLLSATYPGHGPSLIEANLRTGALRRIGATGITGFGSVLQVASDLAAAPWSPGRRPPVPSDSSGWRVTGLATGGVLALGGVLLLRRRTRV